MNANILIVLSANEVHFYNNDANGNRLAGSFVHLLRELGFGFEYYESRLTEEELTEIISSAKHLKVNDHRTVR